MYHLTCALLVYLFIFHVYTHAQTRNVENKKFHYKDKTHHLNISSSNLNKTKDGNKKNIHTTHLKKSKKKDGRLNCIST